MAEDVTVELERLRRECEAREAENQTLRAELGAKLLDLVDMASAEMRRLAARAEAAEAESKRLRAENAELRALRDEPAGAALREANAVTPRMWAAGTLGELRDELARVRDKIDAVLAGGCA
jgi:hypothetical protein